MSRSPEFFSTSLFCYFLFLARSSTVLSMLSIFLFSLLGFPVAALIFVHASLPLLPLLPLLLLRLLHLLHFKANCVQYSFLLLLQLLVLLLSLLLLLLLLL